MPVVVGYGAGWRAAEVDRLQDFAAFGVDDRGAVAVAVEGEDALGGWIVDDAADARIGLGFADCFQGLQVEDDHFGLRAIGDEAAVEFAGDGDAVVLGEAGNGANRGAAVGVHDVQFGAVGHVDAAGGGVHEDAVKGFLTAALRGIDGVGFAQVVAAVRLVYGDAVLRVRRASQEQEEKG